MNPIISIEDIDKRIQVALAIRFSVHLEKKTFLYFKKKYGI